MWPLAIKKMRNYMFIPCGTFDVLFYTDNRLVYIQYNYGMPFTGKAHNFDVAQFIT